MAPSPAWLVLSESSLGFLPCRWKEAVAWPLLQRMQPLELDATSSPCPQSVTGKSLDAPVPSCSCVGMGVLQPRASHRREHFHLAIDSFVCSQTLKEAARSCWLPLGDQALVIPGHTQPAANLWSLPIPHWCHPSMAWPGHQRALPCLCGAFSHAHPPASQTITVMLTGAFVQPAAHQALHDLLMTVPCGSFSFFLKLIF